jgi:hypothetical protein
MIVRWQAHRDVGAIGDEVVELDVLLLRDVSSL